MNEKHIVDEVDQMTDEEFLERRKLVVNGKVTNAAMLLLGNSAYDYLFEDVPEASWRIYDSKEIVKDYKIFKIPLLRSVTGFWKIFESSHIDICRIK